MNFIKKNLHWFTVLLFYISFPIENEFLSKFLPVFAWVALVPLIVSFRKRKLSEIYKQAFLMGLVVNFACFGWMRSFGSGVPVTGPIVITVFLIPALSVFWVTKILISEYLIRKLPEYSIVIYPAVWTFIDFIESIGFMAFPWIYLGYTQYQYDPIIQITSVTGILFFNMIMVFSSSIIAEVIINRKNPFLKKIYSVISIVFCIIIISLFVWGNSRLNKNYTDEDPNNLNVSIVQSVISPWDNWNANRYQYLGNLTNLSDKALQENPDTELLIWSESSTLETISYNYKNENNNLFERKVLNYANNKNVYLVTGEIGRIDDYKNMRILWQNSSVLIDPQGHIDSIYAKIHLCPFGEWFPYERWLPWVVDIIHNLGGSSFIPGKSPELMTINDLKVGMLICYESMFFRLNRKYTDLGADFLINITNDGWSDYYKGHMQHFAAAKVRAVENGRWLLRAGNTGYTAVVDPLGRVVKSIPILEKGYLTYKVNTSWKINTFYTKYGDIIFYISEILIFILLTFSFCCKKIFSKSIE